jgi:hypothetical protein
MILNFPNQKLPSSTPQGKIDEQAGIAYTNLLLTQEGQNLIEKAGFVGLK